MGDVEPRTEQIDHLVILVVLDHFLQRHQIGSECAKTIDEHRPAVGPCSVAPPQVQRDHTHVTGARPRARKGVRRHDALLSSHTGYRL